MVQTLPMRIYLIIIFQPAVACQQYPRMKQQSLNRRELYKNQKLQQINQIYYCECGKNYLTFSALYLHARNKHQVKLTTKRAANNCRVEEKDGKSIVTYFVKEVGESPVVQTGEKQSGREESGRGRAVLEVIEQYVDQECGGVKGTLLFEVQVIEQFKTYLREVQQLVGQQLDDPQEITLYFNEFVTYYLPLSIMRGSFSAQLFPYAEPTLIHLWQWLRRKELTDLQLLHRWQSSFVQPTP